MKKVMKGVDTYLELSGSSITAYAKKIGGHFKHLQTYSNWQDVSAYKQSTQRGLLIGPSVGLKAFNRSLLSAPKVLTNTSQQTLIKKSWTVQQPFEELAENISSCNVLRCQYYPCYQHLKRLLTQGDSTDRRTLTLKNKMIKAKNRRFISTEGDPLNLIAILLESHYKHRRDSIFILSYTRKCEGHSWEDVYWWNQLFISSHIRAILSICLCFYFCHMRIHHLRLLISRYNISAVFSWF